MFTIGYLGSGNLGLQLLQFVHKTQRLQFVMTDKLSLPIVAYCEAHMLPVYIGNPNSAAGRAFVLPFSIELLVSVNYLFLIDDQLIQKPSRLAFNIHGSLLPKYRGRTPHVWAIINNEAETGITAHEIDAGCDSGAIIRQVRIPITTADTGASVLARFESEYERLVGAVFDDMQHDRLQRSPQDHSKATYFGKRTPDDGLINWNWQKERIRNWVRAQAYPYPGAFTFFGAHKITIDEIVFSELGFTDDIANGTIMQQHPCLVKTPNGLVELKTIRGGFEHFTVPSHFKNVAV